MEVVTLIDLDGLVIRPLPEARTFVLSLASGVDSIRFSLEVRVICNVLDSVALVSSKGSDCFLVGKRQKSQHSCRQSHACNKWLCGAVDVNEVHHIVQTQGRG